MALLGFELEEIARLLALVDAEQWEELILEEEGRALRIRGPRRGNPARAGAAPEFAAAPAALPGRARAAKAVEPELAPHQIALTSPMVGVFYRSNAPGAPPLARVGDPIAVGQAIGIIEAMKIFSEIPAEHAGVVVAVPAQDGQLVQNGTPLIILQQD